MINQNQNQIQKMKTLESTFKLVKSFNLAERTNGNIRDQTSNMFPFTNVIFGDVNAHRMNIEQEKVVQARARVAEDAFDEYHHSLSTDYDNLLSAEVRYLVAVKRALMHTYTKGEREW